MARDKGLSIEIAELWNNGLTAPQIAERLGMTANAVYKRCRRLRIEKHKSGYNSFLDNPEMRRWFIRSYPDLSNQTIAIYLGLSADYIGRVAHRLGLRKSKEYVSGSRRAGAEGKSRDNNGKFTKRETV